ncbi:hypothetical protein [Pseudarthrobacter oxydans]|uniref:hypothetical protein n=1 Tax=Pseudarthrobacter oxydans TaxID=1671 RepID=UPI003F4E593B
MFRTDHEYHGCFRNHENISDIDNKGKTKVKGQYPRGSGPSGLRDELTGFETAKVNRTQRSGGQAGQGNGGFGNQGNTSPAGQPTAQDDPWATPATSTAGGWGAGTDSEPPF